MRIQVTAIIMPVISTVIIIILAMAPMAYTSVSVYGIPLTNYGIQVASSEGSSTESTSSDNGEQTAEQLNGSSTHADIIDQSTDPLPPNNEVNARSAAPYPSQYSGNSVQIQDYHDFTGALSQQGYKYDGVIYTHAFEDNRDVVIVTGVTGNTNQPIPDLLSDVGKAWGYQLVAYAYNNNGQLITVFVEAF